MKVGDFLEVVSAIHLSTHVESTFSECGGVMVVGPVAALKSSLLEVLDKNYFDVMFLSDINQKTIVSVRDQIAARRIRTLIFPELAKLYERKAESSSGLEGIIRAMAGEGFRSASFEDSRIARQTARALVMGAMTPAFARLKADGWEQSGFARRFLWSQIVLSNPNILAEAVINWERIPLHFGSLPQVPLGASIPNLTTAAERRRAQNWVRDQPGQDNTVQFQVMVKALAVLKWWFRESGQTSRDPVEVLDSYAVSLGKNALMLDLESVPSMSPQKMAAEKRKIEKADLAAAARKLSAKGKRHATKKK